MNVVSKWFFATFLSMLVTLVWAAPPQAVDAGYRLTRMGQPFGTALETFRREGGQYRIESVTSAVGVFALFAKGKVRLLSQGEITEQGLRPSHFEHHRGDDPRKRIVADFDWEGHTLVHQHDGRRDSVELPPGTQDRISLLYQFMFQPPGRAGVDVVMSNGRQLGRYLYKVVGEETLVTPAGTFETVRLSKYQDGRRDGTEVWLARGQHYFPVRIVLDEKDGVTLEQELTSLKFAE